MEPLSMPGAKFLMRKKSHMTCLEVPFMTKINNIDDIQRAVEVFATERDWNKFHTPKNLAIALSVEASELLEHFQWIDGKETQQLPAETLAAVREEIADVQVYLARLADKLNIDIFNAVEEKMVKNRENYPIEKCYGSAKKYTAYRED